MEKIYKNGEVVDLSDEGEFVDKLNNDINIHYAIKRLTPRQREVVWLILAGHKEVEIAEILGVNKASISKILKRARQLSGGQSV